MEKLFLNSGIFLFFPTIIIIVIVIGDLLGKKDWNRLSKEEENVIVHKATEAPFSGEFDRHFEKGTYLCRRCNAPLYKSDSKFASGCGWPSFDNEIKGAVKRLPDSDGKRIEIQCASCSAHLGHVFTGEHLTEKNTRHCVNSLSMKFIPDKQEKETIVFASGCFWCTEAVFLTVKGVIEVIPGYVGGKTKNPSYKEVSAGKTGHAESAKIEFDPKIVSLEELLQVFFDSHDATSLNRQGNDIGTQYRSGIFYSDEKQKQEIEASVKKIQKNYEKPIATEIKKLEAFFPAEEYHKNYCKKNPLNPYCLLVVKPKLEKIKKKIKFGVQKKYL